MRRMGVRTRRPASRSTPPSIGPPWRDEAGRSGHRRRHHPHPRSPPQNAPSSTWGVKRVVVTLATTSPGVPRPAAARAPNAAIEQRRVAATAWGDRAAPAAAATADNAAPPAAATVTVRVAVASDGARWREGRSRTTKLGAAAGRRPRTHWPPRPPPRRGLADAQRRPRARPADGSAPVRT